MGWIVLLRATMVEPCMIACKSHQPRLLYFFLNYVWALLASCHRLPAGSFSLCAELGTKVRNRIHWIKVLAFDGGFTLRCWIMLLSDEGCRGEEILRTLHCGLHKSQEMIWFPPVHSLWRLYITCLPALCLICLCCHMIVGFMWILAMKSSPPSLLIPLSFSDYSY